MDDDSHRGVLTQFLADVRAVGSRYCVSELGHPWAIEFSGRGTCYFHVVDEGGCWLRIDARAPMWLAEGDLVVLPHGQGHALGDPLTRTPLRVDFDRYPKVWGAQAPARWGEGLPRTRLVCGEFWLESGAHPVLEHLPLVLHVHGRSPDAPTWLRSTLDLPAAEAVGSAPMVEAVITRLVDFLFLQTVRACIADEAPPRFAALRDPKIAETIVLMREAPSRDWTVEDLARRVGRLRIPPRAHADDRASPLRQPGLRLRGERATVGRSPAPVLGLRAPHLDQPEQLTVLSSSTRASSAKCSTSRSAWQSPKLNWNSPNAVAAVARVTSRSRASSRVSPSFSVSNDLM
ncbi:MAG: cupin domain-containing protein [Deltaproteobacteria bacterium]|nr:cupin domain-containing protein [Nannocystaceae bacterium]